MENEIIVKTNNTKVENIFNEDGRVTSVELVKLINKFRSMESEANEEKVFKELEHKDFMKKIRKELEVLKNLGLGNEGNISPVKYTDKKGEIRPCYLLNRDGTLQMLNSESTYVRAMTIEYINKLEKQLKEMNKDSYLIADPIERAKRWIEEQEERKKRRAIGIELKESYYKQSVLNCKNALIERTEYDENNQIIGQTSLFDK